MIALSENFTLAELCHSDTATREGIQNIPDALAINNLKRLTVAILQPCRDKFGAIDVTSGFRSLELNALISKSSNSQHMKGEAADFLARAVSAFKLAEWIKDNLEFDQLILEYHNGKEWVHCSFASENRNTILTYIGGKYLPGLHKKSAVKTD